MSPRSKEAVRRLTGRVPPPVLQYAKFGLVGGFATLFHSILFVAFVGGLGVRPMLANSLAFSCALVVSYLGNYRWTFGAGSRSWLSFTKFAVVSLIGFGLNSLAIFVIVDRLELSYLYSLPVMIGLVPPVVFVLNRTWTFGARQPPAHAETEAIYPDRR
ncbi:GtrA family protein [Aurantimonas sp. VKM B-3413]|uniref:GtrA family protein n=1 Tax=Aurantimonas sp. VKM B-3413 TaxID=2779401 RepID=UPI001E3F8EDB|nr:GtrA family protein [Aurantimonas sp. VKM B-3413]MCB8839383.1 GtrA family protein [Aurantimonas sp. VKM B-3413]